MTFLSSLIKICLSTYFIGGLFLSPHTALGQVLINEVHPHPSSGPDWIEIINLSPLPVDLSGWSIMDALSSPTIIYTVTDTVLHPLQLLVIEVSNKLNNGGDGVTLYDQDHRPIDAMMFSQSFSSMSWARELDGIGNFISTAPSRGQYNNQEVLPSLPPLASPSPPPPSPSATTSPSPSPSPPSHNYDFLSLSEVVACPAEGEQEWVEIFNNSPERVELKEWVIKDSHSNQRIFDLGIDPWSYGVITWSGSLLNNTGDQVVLLTPQKVEIESLDLPSCTSGTSYARFSTTWELTDQITPSSANRKPSHQKTFASPSPTGATTSATAARISPPLPAQVSDSAPQGSLKQSPPYLGSLPNLLARDQVLGVSTGDSDSSQNLTAPTPRPVKTAALSAIMGGLCMSLVGSYSLYETLNQTASSLD